MSKLLNVPLPKCWPEHTKLAILHAITQAHFVLSHARSWCINSRISRVRLAAERDIAIAKVAQLEEIVRILSVRLALIEPNRRPQYPPAERLAILLLRGSVGWTIAKTARMFLVTPQTIARWMKRLDDDGPDALLALRQPVNRFPDFVRETVRALRATFPSLGSQRIANMLARAGVHLAASTVGRISKEEPPSEPSPGEQDRATDNERVGETETDATTPRVVTARYPHHLWHVDLSLLPRVAGWWVSWVPHSLKQAWPFCFWIGVVLDHFSRSVVAWRLYLSQPSAKQVCSLLEKARRNAGVAPKHIVTDRGPQFAKKYKAWCKRRGVKPRFGAIGKSGSIAIIERFFRSLKDEMLWRLPVLMLSLPRMRAEVSAYIEWYHEHRPHMALGGATPAEFRDGRTPARDLPRWSLRAGVPLPRGDPAQRVAGLQLVTGRVQGRNHLPIVSLRDAA